MTVIRYCPACGARLDDEGICTSTPCPRRKLQLNAKAKQEAADAAKEAQKNAATLEKGDVGGAA